jgi:two-component system sensor histidine kinase RegB
MSDSDPQPEIERSLPGADPPVGWRFLISLRFGAIVGKVLVLALAWLAFGAELPLLTLAALLVVEALSNAALLALSPRRPLAPGILLTTLVIDVGLLTALLLVTGAAANPFSFLYLVYVAVAAVSQPAGWAWALAGLTTAAFGSLFMVPGEHHGHQAMARHLYGMWLAYAVAAAFIVFFVHRLRGELAHRQRELARAERLASVTTLAAGAAHELSTPLATIAVAAEELEELLEDRDDNASRHDLVADVALIREQVRRCKEILRLLHADVGAPLGEAPREITIAELLAPLAAERTDLQLREADDSKILRRLPVSSVRIALKALIDNGYESLRDATGTVSLEVRAMQHDLHLVVTDTGRGMGSEELERATEPFYSSKAPGQGMGLGLFLAGGGGAAARWPADPRIAAQQRDAGDSIVAHARGSRDRAGGTMNQPLRATQLLLVDDDEPFRARLARALERRGGRCHAGGRRRRRPRHRPPPAQSSTAP